jgi:hypothetical protein
MELRLRRLLAGVFGIGAVGTLVELFLLEHTEDFWQWTPLVLLGVGAIALLVASARPKKLLVIITRVLMWLFVVNGALGVYFHFKGNIEFEKEMYPSMTGFELIWESLKGATPTLAPGAILLLGLVGLVYCHRHPVTETRESS